MPRWVQPYGYVCAFFPGERGPHGPAAYFGSPRLTSRTFLLIWEQRVLHQSNWSSHSSLESSYASSQQLHTVTRIVVIATPLIRIHGNKSRGANYVWCKPYWSQWSFTSNGCRNIVFETQKWKQTQNSPQLSHGGFSTVWCFRATSRTFPITDRKSTWWKESDFITFHCHGR